MWFNNSKCGRCAIAIIKLTFINFTYVLTCILLKRFSVLYVEGKRTRNHCALTLNHSHVYFSLTRFQNLRETRVVISAFFREAGTTIEHFFGDNFAIYPHKLVPVVQADTLQMTSLKLNFFFLYQPLSSSPLLAPSFFLFLKKLRKQMPLCRFPNDFPSKNSMRYAEHFSTIRCIP